LSELSDLLKVLSSPTPKSGVVVLVAENTVTVSTSAGPKVIRNTGAYQRGDTLMLRGDEILGKTASVASLPVYYV